MYSKPFYVSHFEVPVGGQMVHLTPWELPPVKYLPALLHNKYYYSLSQQRRDMSLLFSDSQDMLALLCAHIPVGLSDLIKFNFDLLCRSLVSKRQVPWSLSDMPWPLICMHHYRAFIDNSIKTLSYVIFQLRDVIISQLFADTDVCSCAYQKRVLLSSKRTQKWWDQSKLCQS